MPFYHISMHNHGDYFQFEPRVPETAIISKEGNIPRVCVCPTLYQCLKAISSSKILYSFDIITVAKKLEDYIIQPFVYKVIGDLEPYLPPNVSDFRENEEHWFITPVMMKRVGCIDLVQLSKGKVSMVKNLLPIEKELLAGPGKDVIVKKPRNSIKYRGVAK